jgi:hypothetical protein
MRPQREALFWRSREPGRRAIPQSVVSYCAVLKAESHPTPDLLSRHVRSSMSLTIFKKLEV